MVTQELAFLQTLSADVRNVSYWTLGEDEPGIFTIIVYGDAERTKVIARGLCKGPGRVRLVLSDDCPYTEMRARIRGGAG